MKKSLSIMLVVLCFFATACNNKTKDGSIIGKSNKVNNNVLQVTVIVDYINIRERADVTSEKLGVVKRSSVFNVVKLLRDDNYIWFKIKTNNNIEGYIASPKDEPWITVNKDMDFISPTLIIKDSEITVKTRNEIDKAVKDNLDYYDDKDETLKVEYVTNYNNIIEKYKYIVDVFIYDNSNNVSKGRFKVNITQEKQIKPGEWISYRDMLKKQKDAKSVCYKYGMSEWEAAVGCHLFNDYYDISIANNGATRIGFNSLKTFCNYDLDLNVDYCVGSNGNNISHELISDNLKEIEKEWLIKFKNYKNEVKNKTGYELSELIW